MPKNQARPEVLGFSLCDAVSVCPVTGKETVLGCHSVIAADSVPTMTHPACVRVEVIGLPTRTEFELAVEFQPEDDLEPRLIYVVPFAIDANDRLEAFAYYQAVSSLHLPRFGRYSVVLRWNDERIAERPLTLIQR